MGRDNCTEVHKGGQPVTDHSKVAYSECSCSPIPEYLGEVREGRARTLTLSLPRERMSAKGDVFLRFFVCLFFTLTINFCLY